MSRLILCCCPSRLFLLTSLIASLIVGCTTAAQFQRLPDDESMPSSLLHDQSLDQTNQNWNWTVVLAISDGVIDLFQNWLYWFQMLALDMKVVVIAHDHSALLACPSSQQVLCQLQSDSRSNDSKTIASNKTLNEIPVFDYASEGYKRLVSSRAAYLLDAVQSHGNIIYTDVDTVWLEDPRPFLTTGVDLWMTIDEEPPGQQEPDFCTGFMALLPTKATHSILRAWDEQLTQDPQLNQPLFNRLLQAFKPNISVGNLDRQLFPSGDIFFGEKGRVAHDTDDVPAKQPSRVVVVHNNWIKGKHLKVQRFKDEGLWKDLPTYMLSSAAGAQRGLGEAGRGGDGKWKRNVTQALQDMLAYYEEAVTNIDRYNSYAWNAWAYDEKPQPLGIVAYMLCHIKARCDSAVRMVQAAGFVDVRLIPTKDSGSMHLEALVEAGDVSGNFAKGSTHAQRLRYIANALDHRHLLDVARQGDYSWVAIFEDDVILTTCPSVAASRIRGALGALPAEADTLHLEYCFDACDKALFSRDNHWACAAHQPFCSAAIVYSSKGLSKLRSSLDKVTTAHDDRIASLCHERHLNCFKLRHPVFAQDMYWKSSLSPDQDGPSLVDGKHELHWDVPLCRGDQGQLTFVRVDMANHYKPPQATLPELPGRQVRHPEDMLVSIKIIVENLPWALTVRVSGLSEKCMYNLSVRYFVDANEEIMAEDRVLIMRTGETATSIDMQVSLFAGNATKTTHQNTIARECKNRCTVYAVVEDTMIGLKEDDILLATARSEPIVDFCVPVSASDLKQPVRQSSIPESAWEKEEEASGLHGDNHPPVSIRFASNPLESTSEAGMELTFDMRGLLPGFTYIIIVQEINDVGKSARQTSDTILSIDHDASSDDGHEMTAGFRILDQAQETFRFGIAVWEKHQGLGPNEGLVAKRDLTVSLSRVEVPRDAGPAPGARRLCLLDGECVNHHKLGMSSRQLVRHDDSEMAYRHWGVGVRATACLARARKWHLYCGNPLESPITATFMPMSQTYTFPNRDVDSEGGLGWVMLLHVTDGYLDFFDNFWRHYEMIENWKVPHVVKVVVASEATKRYMHEVYGDRLEVEAGANNNNDDGQHAFGFFDKGFNAVVHERPSLIAKELMAGRNVLYLDVDLVLRTDPFAHLTDGYQMWTAMDHEGVSRGRAKSTHHCTAVLAMLATPRVIQFVLDWEEHMTHGNYTFSDQTAFNEVIQSSENTDINVLELSELLFPPGSVYFSPEFELHRAQVVVVHNNYLVGHANKKRRFIDHGLWRAQSRCTNACSSPTHDKRLFTPMPTTMGGLPVNYHHNMTSVRAIWQTNEAIDTGCMPGANKNETEQRTEHSTSAQSNTRNERLFKTRSQVPECQRPKIFIEKATKKMICLDSIIPNSCTVYSFGINYQWEFDDFMHDYGCVVRSFDPGMKYKNQRNVNHFFEAVGIGVYSGWHEGESTLYSKESSYKVETITSIMKRLGDSHIDLLRLDVESAEFDVLDTLSYDRIDQLSIEVHMWKHTLPEWTHKLQNIKLQHLQTFQNTDKVNPATMTEIAPGITRVYEMTFAKLAEKENEAIDTGRTDVLIVSNYVNCVTRAVIDGLKTHLANIGDIHVIVPQKVLSVCESVSDVICHNENAILNSETSWLYGKNRLGWTPAASRRGWYYQQMLKLLALQRIQLSHNFVVWDADNVLLKTYAPFLHKRSRFLTAGGGMPEKGQYLPATKALVGEVETRRDVVVHQMPINRAILQELIAHVCGHRMSEACARHILDSIPTSAHPTLGFSEYHLYYTWVSTRHPENVFLDHNKKLIRTSKQVWTTKSCSTALSSQYASDVFMVVLEQKTDYSLRNREAPAATATEHDLHGDNHPPVSIRFASNPLESTSEAGMELTFDMRGLLPGFTYIIIVQEINDVGKSARQTSDTILSIDHDASSDDGHEMTAGFRILDQAQETFRFGIAVWEKHQGLGPNEGLVAKRDLTVSLSRVEVPRDAGPAPGARRLCLLDGECVDHPDRRKVDLIKGCKARQLWPDLHGAKIEDNSSVGLDTQIQSCNSKPATPGVVTLVTVASIERMAQMLSVAKHWDGPMSAVMYARDPDEERAVQELVANKLSQWLWARKDVLQILAVSCSLESKDSETYTFPINLLRHLAVACAQSDLVFYVDVDFLPSSGSARLIYQHARRTDFSSEALVVPCFVPQAAEATGEAWPPLGIFHGDCCHNSNASGCRNCSQGQMIEVKPLLIKDLLQQVASGSMVMPGLNHGSTDYFRWLNETSSLCVPTAREIGKEAQETCLSSFPSFYTLGWEPYIVISRSSWTGVSRHGMFDPRFLERGWDKASFVYEAGALGYRFRTLNGIFLAHASEAAISLCPQVFGTSFCRQAETSALGSKAGWSETLDSIKRAFVLFASFVQSVSKHLHVAASAHDGDIRDRANAMPSRETPGPLSTCMIVPSATLAELTVPMIYSLLGEVYDAMADVSARLAAMRGPFWWRKGYWFSFSEMWCEKMPVIANLTAIQEHITISVALKKRGQCAIDGKCFKYKELGGLRDDSDIAYRKFKVGINASACLARARQWHQFCGNPETSPVTATWVPTSESHTFPRDTSSFPM